MTSSVVVVPELDRYSAAFALRLADELEAMAAPCERIDPQPGCSAAAAYIMDHKHLRGRVRALEGEGYATGTAR